jgi:hypothetical protein
MYPTKGFRPSRPLQLNNVKCKKKSKNVHLFSCYAVLCVLLTACVVLTAVCIYVICKCLKSEALISSKNWASQANGLAPVFRIFQKTFKNKN